VTYVFLHAGQPKTGTSAVQRFCARNRHALLRLGYLYPLAGMKPAGNHLPLVHRILGLPVSPEHENASNVFLEEINQHQNCAVVLSAEYLFFHFCGKHGSCSPFLSFMQRNGLKVTILSYLRPDDEQINSAYAQLVKTFRIDESLDQFVARRVEKNPKRYANLIHLTKGPGVEVHFFPYDEELKRDGVTRHLLTAIGMPPEDVASFGPEGRVNESPGPIAIAVARDTLASVRQCGQEPSQRQCDALGKALIELIGGERKEAPYQGIDDTLYDEIESAVAGDRDIFAQAVWGRKWKDLFPPRLRRPCNAFMEATAEPAALEQYRRIADALWARATVIMADQRLAKIRPWDRWSRMQFRNRQHS